MTIVIRREEGEGGGHHGGAWKVAYADFVTAMMAFFLLMWLLNATTEEQRSGLADYFAPTNLFGRSASGSGQPFGGKTPNDDGTSTSSDGSPQVVKGPRPPQQDVEEDDADTPARPPMMRATLDEAVDSPDAQPDGRAAKAAAQQGQGRQVLARGGDYAAARLTPSPNQDAATQEALRREANQDDAQRESRALEQAGAQLRNAIQSDPALREIAGQLMIDSTPQGLRIQVVDDERRPMFALGSAAPNRRVRDLMQKVVPVLAGLSNAITIAGHTDSHTYRGQEKGNWELSADRANATRRLLLESGLADGRIRSVTGNADRDLMMPADPFNPVNRRITMVVLRNAGAEAGQATP